MFKHLSKASSILTKVFFNELFFGIFNEIWEITNSKTEDECIHKNLPIMVTKQITAFHSISSKPIREAIKPLNVLAK